MRAGLFGECENSFIPKGDDFHNFLFPVLHDYAEFERPKKEGYLPVPTLPDPFSCCI